MSEDDLLKEFEEDMRRERSEAAWKNFGKYAVWLSIAIILGTASGVSWRYWQQTQQEKQTGLLLQGQQLIEAGDYKQAISVLDELTQHKSSALYGPAMLSKASAQYAAGNSKQAAETYAALAAESGADGKPYAKLAGIYSIQKPATNEPNPGEPFYYTQMERRGWQLYEDGNTEGAVSVFTTLHDDSSTPPSMRGRIAEALQLMAPDTLVPEAKQTDTADAEE